jgi:putative ABC transport system permease protein
MILLYVRYELSYDKWIPGSERSYQVQAVNTDLETGAVTREQMTAFPVGLALAKDLPQIEAASRAIPSSEIELRDGEANEVPVLMVDTPFLTILPLPFLHGDPATALEGMDAIVLTEQEAIKRFGRSDVVGQLITVSRSEGKAVLRVTGVIRDLPSNTHLDIGLVTRFNAVKFSEYVDQWGLIGGYNYVKLRPGADLASIHAQLPAWEKRNIPAENVGNVRRSPGDPRDWYLTPVADVHLGEAQDSAMTPGNDPRTIVTFVIIAALILGMACVNFTNLATARASQRAREVALRKVLGATRSNLVFQFMGESMLLATISMLFALALVETALPLLSAFLEANLALDYFGANGIFLPVLGLVLLVGGAGGLYPAVYLSRFQPARVLKANRSGSDTDRSGQLRNLLVVGQFAVSIGLIICTLIVYLQTDHARTTDAGYNREGLLQVAGIDRKKVSSLRDTLVQQMRAVEGVRSLTLTNTTIGTGGNTLATDAQVPGRPEPVRIETYAIDPTFASTIGARLLAGRTLSEAHALDEATFPEEDDPAFARGLVARGMNIIVNRTAAERLGFRTPQGAIGRQIGLALVSDEYGLVPATIVGVISDVRFRSLRDPVEPTFYRFDKTGDDKLLLRYEGQPNAVRERVAAVWRLLLPDVPFDADFADEAVAEMYQSDQQRAQIFGGFSLLAVVIACLGLFGLAAFAADRRTKEIGIRKVLGATVRDIVQLLAWQFSKPVILANIIAWPVAWWVMRDWLNGFDARIPLGPGPFFLAGLIALAIAIGTVAGHALRVARLNPIHALRYE